MRSFDKRLTQAMPRIGRVDKVGTRIDRAKMQKNLAHKESKMPRPESGCISRGYMGCSCSLQSLAEMSLVDSHCKAAIR
ncbi:MAG: hypothetical protein DHS20C16_09730 [Phycisphaerae bacterium]|nr:MAG: hypothetical protein DHS20C16_09730 [Phycisphaerae bacterium]